MGWASGFQSGIQLGNAFIQGQQRNALAEEAAKHKVTDLEVDRAPVEDVIAQRDAAAQGFIERGMSSDQAYQQATQQFLPQLQENARTVGLAPQYAYGDQSFVNRQEAEQAMGLGRTQGMANVLRGLGDEEKASALEARALQTRAAGLSINKQQREEDTDLKIQAIDKQAGTFMDNRLKQEDGSMRAPTTDDMIAQIQHRVTLLQKGGLGREATNAMKDWQGVAANAIQLTTAQRTEDLGKTIAALGQGDFKPAQAFYDKYVMDGAKTTGIVQNKDGSLTVSRVRDDGVKLPDTKVANIDALGATLRSFNDPNKLYEFSQNEFKNNLLARQVKATESRAADAKELTGLNKKLINARIENYEARTKGLQAPPPLTEAQVTARARSMVTSREINPDTRKAYTTSEAVEFVKSGRRRDPVADALDAALGGDTDPFAD